MDVYGISSPSPLPNLDGVSDGSCPFLCQSSWLEMHGGYLIHRIWRRQMLIKTCSLWTNFSMCLQVSTQLYKRTDSTMLMNSLNFFKCLFDVNKTDIRCWLPFLRLFNDDSGSYCLVCVRSTFPEPCLFLSQLAVCSFSYHLQNQPSVHNYWLCLAEIRVEVWFLSYLAVSKIPFVGNLYNIACLPFHWHFILLPCILQRINHDICSDPSVCFMTSAGILLVSGPVALPFLIFLMASTTFALVMGPRLMSRSSPSSISSGLTTGVPLSRLLNYSFH